MASQLINKQSGMEGQIRDRRGGGAGKRRVGTGGGRVQMMRDCKVSNEINKVQIILMPHCAIFFTY